MTDNDAALAQIACVVFVSITLLALSFHAAVADDTIPHPARTYVATSTGEMQCVADGQDAIVTAIAGSRVTWDVGLPAMIGVGVVCEPVASEELAVKMAVAVACGLNDSICDSMQAIIASPEPYFWDSFRAAPWLYDSITQH
jgi:carbon monoxide dehydrogenase subunit G